MTDSLAAQVAPYGIGVFAITPGLLRTDMGVALAERRGNIREGDWVSPKHAARLVTRIANGDLDALSGRFVNAATDDVDELVERAGEIRSRDLQQLRLRALGEAAG
jgi:NAD(P)-dependent dehydrogenase (short-subunit alcohol dehydrogenase family)